MYTGAPTWDRSLAALTFIYHLFDLQLFSDINCYEGSEEKWWGEPYWVGEGWMILFVFDKNGWMCSLEQWEITTYLKRRSQRNPNYEVITCLDTVVINTNLLWEVILPSTFSLISSHSILFSIFIFLFTMECIIFMQ